MCLYKLIKGSLRLNLRPMIAEWSDAEKNVVWEIKKNTFPVILIFYFIFWITFLDLGLRDKSPQGIVQNYVSN